MQKKHILATALLAAAAAIGMYLFFARKQSPTGQSSPQQAQQYGDSATCVSCHREEAEGFARTGMAHAFARADAQNTGNLATTAPYYHAVSQTYFSTISRDGHYYQRRWQKGFDGNPDNVEELSIDYVMGSGNHARTYLHRDPDGTLIELPLGWYAEDGGHWAMSPGFDSAYPMTRRPIAYECMFCHNGYPQIPDIAHRDLTANPVYTGELPHGIDCQRCHGPGAAHIKAAQTKAPVAQIRATILNPDALTPDRQMQVCEQCHLETTSRLLPDRIRHYDRGPFDYKAGEPLESFTAYFERDPSVQHSDEFEIVNSVYRLRQSQCYRQTQGALTCETCHDPHDLHKGAASASYYANVCMRCHEAAIKAEVATRKHPSGVDCVSCHMPKRRTDDVIHAVMTDHWIQARPAPAATLLAQRKETPDVGPYSYRGPVKRYTLDHEQPQPDDALYDALAQVIDSSDLAAGVPALQQQIAQNHPEQPTPYIELGDALRHHGDLTGAIASYREALQHDQQSSRAQRRLGVALGEAGQTAEALSTFTSAISDHPANALLWYEKALLEGRSGRTAQAIEDLRKTISLQPGFADAQNNLGSFLVQAGDTTGAETAFRAALDINPYDAGTHANLGRLLASREAWPEAAFQLQRSEQLAPADPQAHLDAAAVLLQLHRVAAAEVEARAGITADPRSPRAHDICGQVLLEKHSTAAAEGEFQAALKFDPEYGPAALDLAETYLDRGQDTLALPLLQKAANSSSAPVSAQARSLLAHLRPH